MEGTKRTNMKTRIGKITGDRNRLNPSRGRGRPNSERRGKKKRYRRMPEDPARC